MQDSENQTERAGWTLGWRFLRMFGIGPSGKPETEADDDGAEELEVAAAIDTLVEELAPEEVDGIPVNIWLFGALSALPVERPLALRLPEGSTAGDVVAEANREGIESSENLAVALEGVDTALLLIVRDETTLYMTLRRGEG